MKWVEGGYVRIARRRWPAILVCLVIGLAVAFGITRTVSKTYQANSEVFVNIVSGNSGSQSVIAQLSSELIQSYSYLAVSNSVSRHVQSVLGLHSAPSLGATAVPGTFLIDMTATASSPVLAEQELTSAMSSFSVAVKTYQAGDGISVDVKVVQPASASASPVSPRRDLDLVYGAVSGLLVGLLLAALLEYVDKSFRDVSDLDGVDVGPLLGRIPRVKGTRPAQLVSGEGSDSNDAAAALEAYAALRASLRFIEPDRPLRTILFTSPGQGDGKTTTVANLAEVLARAGEVAVAVDADLRDPGLAKAFGLAEEPGLTSVVIGAEPLGAALRWRGGLGVLPPGPLPPNPSEIVGSQQMATLVDALAQRTDRVLIDAPAALAVSDPLALAPMVDGVVLVLRPGTTRRDEIEETCRRLDVIGARTVGHVINGSAGVGANGLYSRRSRDGETPASRRADLQLLPDAPGRTA